MTIQSWKYDKPGCGKEYRLGDGATLRFETGTEHGPLGVEDSVERADLCMTHLAELCQLLVTEEAVGMQRRLATEWGAK